MESGASFLGGCLAGAGTMALVNWRKNKNVADTDGSIKAATPADLLFAREMTDVLVMIDQFNQVMARCYRLAKSCYKDNGIGAGVDSCEIAIRSRVMDVVLGGPLKRANLVSDIVLEYASATHRSYPQLELEGVREGSNDVTGHIVKLYNVTLDINGTATRELLASASVTEDEYKYLMHVAQ